MAKLSRNQKKIHEAVRSAKEDLTNIIAKHFGVAVPVRLVPPESIYLGAQGSFEGDKIKISRHLPLFWQLLILEHEIGHYLTLAGKPSVHGQVFQAFHVHKFSTSEQRAWEWVEENPIAPGSFIDRVVRDYIRTLRRIGGTYGHMDEVMRLGWWY